MNESSELPTWLSDMVVRLKQSHLTLSIDNFGQLNLSDPLKAFLIEILNRTNKDVFLASNTQFLEEIKQLNPKEIDQITSVVEIVLQPNNQKQEKAVVHQTVHHQYHFYAQPPAAVPAQRPSQDLSAAKTSNFFGQPRPESRATMPTPPAHNPAPLFSIQGSTMEVQNFTVSAPQGAKALDATEGSVIKVQNLQAHIN